MVFGLIDLFPDHQDFIFRGGGVCIEMLGKYIDGYLNACFDGDHWFLFFIRLEGIDV